MFVIDFCFWGQNIYMLDKRTELILIEINKECQNGSFQVVEVNDLISSLPKKYLPDQNLVTQCVNALAREGYIEVKYHDSEVFCLCPLPKGRMVYENKQEKKGLAKRYVLLSVLALLVLTILLILTSFCGVLIFEKLFK